MKNKFEKELKNPLVFFVYAFKGINYAIRNERNFVVHMLATIAVLIGGIWLEISWVEWMILILVVGLVYAAEIFNTAIEQLVNKVSPEYDPQAGLVKDLSAGAVLVISIAAVLVGLCIFFNHI